MAPQSGGGLPGTSGSGSQQSSLRNRPAVSLGRAVGQPHGLCPRRAAPRRSEQRLPGPFAGFCCRASDKRWHFPRRKAKPGASSPRKAEFRRRGARRSAPSENANALLQPGGERAVQPERSGPRGDRAPPAAARAARPPPRAVSQPSGSPSAGTARSSGEARRPGSVRLPRPTGPGARQRFPLAEAGRPGSAGSGAGRRRRRSRPRTPAGWRRSRRGWGRRGAAAGTGTPDVTHGGGRRAALFRPHPAQPPSGNWSPRRHGRSCACAPQLGSLRMTGDSLSVLAREWRVLPPMTERSARKSRPRRGGVLLWAPSRGGGRGRPIGWGAAACAGLYGASGARAAPAGRGPWPAPAAAW